MTPTIGLLDYSTVTLNSNSQLISSLFVSSCILQRLHRFRDDDHHKQRWRHTVAADGRVGCTRCGAAQHTGSRLGAARLQGVRQEEERQSGAQQSEHDSAQGHNVSTSHRRIDISTHR